MIHFYSELLFNPTTYVHVNIAHVLLYITVLTELSNNALMEQQFGLVLPVTSK